MYDMYPDWGATSDHAENPHNQKALQASPDLQTTAASGPTTTEQHQPRRHD